MALTVTKDDVRGRLARADTLDLSDTVLDSSGQISVAVAIVNDMLTNIGTAYDDLSDDRKVIAKGAAIDLAAARALIFYPKPGGRQATVEIKPLKATDTKPFIDELKDSFSSAMKLLGYGNWKVSFRLAGSDDSIPDGTSDLTNLLFSNTSKSFSYFR